MWRVFRLVGSVAGGVIAVIGLAGIPEDVTTWAGWLNWLASNGGRWTLVVGGLVLIVLTQADRIWHRAHVALLPDTKPSISLRAPAPPVTETARDSTEERRNPLGDLRLNIVRADLSGLWRSDPYLEIEIEIENDVALIGFIDKMGGNVSIEGDRCNAVPQFKSVIDGTIHVNGTHDQKFTVIQPVTSAMANSVRDRLSAEGGFITIDLMHVLFSGRGLTGRRIAHFSRIVTDDFFIIRGPVFNEGMAENLVRLPLTLAYHRSTADTADSQT